MGEWRGGVPRGRLLAGRGAGKAPLSDCSVVRAGECSWLLVAGLLGLAAAPGRRPWLRLRRGRSVRLALEPACGVCVWGG
jgi:hypothetical protein